MGGTFKCIFFGSIYQNSGSCSNPDDCKDKEIDPRDKIQSSDDTAEESSW